MVITSSQRQKANQLLEDLVISSGLPINIQEYCWGERITQPEFTILLSYVRSNFDRLVEINEWSEDGTKYVNLIDRYLCAKRRVGFGGI